MIGCALGWAGWGIRGCIVVPVWHLVLLIGLSWCAAGHRTLTVSQGLLGSFHALMFV